jgi:hypothetical protein
MWTAGTLCPSMSMVSSPNTVTLISAVASPARHTVERASPGRAGIARIVTAVSQRSVRSLEKPKNSWYCRLDSIASAQRVDVFLPGCVVDVHTRHWPSEPRRLTALVVLEGTHHLVDWQSGGAVARPHVQHAYDDENDERDDRRCHDPQHPAHGDPHPSQLV